MSTVAIGSIAAAGIGAAGSIAAGSEQAGAAKSAAQLQYEEQQQALQFQEQEWQQQQANQKPFVQAGQGAVEELAGLTSTPGEGLLSPYSGGAFTAPTLAQAEQEPGYQFELQQGEQAVQAAGAAQGNAFSGSQLNAADQFAQGLAQTDYSNVYNRALQTYQTNYNVWQQQQANEYNRLAGLAGTGQTAVGQLGQEGAQAAGNIGSEYVQGGANIGQALEYGGAAQASGYAGAANAVSGGVNNLAMYSALGPYLQSQQQSPYLNTGYQSPDTLNTGITDPSQIDVSGVYQ